MRTKVQIACVSFVGCALIGAVGAGYGCSGSQKRYYRIPEVTANIKKSIRMAKAYRRKGELAKASKVLLAEGKRVTRVYPL